MNRRQAESGRNLWTENLFQPLVVGVMVGCVAWSLVQLLLMFAPTWNPTYLLVGCVLAALEAHFSYRLLQTPRMLGANVTRFRIFELLLIFILLKFGRYIGRSVTDLLAEIQTWPYNLSSVFDVETLSAFVLTIVCWGAATQTASDLKCITTPPARRGGYTFPVERLTNRFFVGGAVLLIAAGLTRIGDTSELLDLRRSSVGGLVINALIYFLLGVVMLGQARFAELRRRWRGQGVQMADQLAGRWVRYSLSFIGLAALLALVLPTEFTLDLLDLVASSLSVIGTVLFFVASLLVTILLLPFGWLLWLLSMLMSRGEYRPPPRPQLPDFEPPQTPAGNGGMSWLEVARVLVFWLVALVSVSYVVYGYLRDRPELREAIAALRPLRALRNVWVALWQWLKAWTARLSQTVGEHLPRGLRRGFSRDGISATTPFRFFRLGALSPRERVLYYYLSILHRAKRQGYPRQRDQTPKEYQVALGPHLPRAQEEMVSLTQAFEEARYSLHEIELAQDRRVRASWERLKAALRALKRQQD